MNYWYYFSTSDWSSLTTTGWSTLLVYSTGNDVITFTAYIDKIKEFSFER